LDKTPAPSYYHENSRAEGVGVFDKFSPKKTKEKEVGKGLT
jgi:hypothetical protein